LAGAPRASASAGDHPPAPADEEPTILATVAAATWDRLSLAAGVAAPFHPQDAHELIAAALRDGLNVTAAVAGATAVGLVASRADATGTRELLAVGVAPRCRRRGLATGMLAAHVATDPTAAFSAEITVAERDPAEPLDRDLRATIARRLLERAGFRIVASEPDVRLADPGMVTAQRTASADVP
jgi:ribosomal protein S18 acetylase RimI-like enzyme